MSTGSGAGGTEGKGGGVGDDGRQAPSADKDKDKDDEDGSRTFWDVFTPSVTPPSPSSGGGAGAQTTEKTEKTTSTVEDVLPPEDGGSGTSWVSPMGRVLLPTSPWLQIQSHLGKGGFGDVYKAGTRFENGKGYVDFVAVKMARMPTPDKSSKPTTRAQRWAKRQKVMAAQAKEAGALKSIPKHQHVVTALSVHDTGRWGLLIVLPLAPFGDVRRWLGSATSSSSSSSSSSSTSPSGRPWTERLCVIMGMAYGLRHLHSLGLVHQDLKEGNVLMFDDCVCGVSDFGLVRGLDRRPSPSSSPPSVDGSGAGSGAGAGAGSGGGPATPSPALTGAGGVPAAVAPTVETPGAPPVPGPSFSSTEASVSHTVSGSVTFAGGTPAYMSPEQRRWERPTVKSDMWSFGLVVWAILMWPGRVRRETPWKGDGFRGGAAVRDFIVSSLEAARREGRGASTLPAWWEDVVEVVSGCLEVDVGKRTSSLRVATALEEVWGKWRASVGADDTRGVGLLEAVIGREAAGRVSSEASRRGLVEGRAEWLWSRPGEWEACAVLYEEMLGWAAGKSGVLARCRLCSVYGGVGDVDLSVSMGLSALSYVGDVDLSVSMGLSALSCIGGVYGMSRLDVWRTLMKECRSGASMYGLLRSVEGVGDVGGWSADNVEDVLISVCENVEKGVSSVVFGHVLEVVDDAVCVGALSGGWVLVEACRCGHVDIVRRLCGMECVDVNYRVGTARQTALWIACHHGEYSVVEVLLGAGVDVNLGDNKNSTPLHQAAMMGHLEIVELLLESGAGVDAREVNGCTALYNACQQGWLDVAKVLVGRQADVNAAKTTGATPLFIACQDGHLSVVKALLAHGVDVNATKTDGATPLLVACQDGHLSVVEALLAREADVNAAKTDGTTPLFIACQEGRLSVVEALLAREADVNTAKTGGTTPLFIACQKGHLSVVKALLARDADVNAAGTNGVSPLYIACQQGHLSVVKALMAHEADVNAAKTDGATPLMIAGYCNHPSVIQVLLDSGADPHLKKFKDGLTALDVARLKNHTAVIEILSAVPAPPSPRFS